VLSDNGYNIRKGIISYSAENAIQKKWKFTIISHNASTTEAQRTQRYIFFVCRETAANENHQPYRAKMISFPLQGIVFTHRRALAG